MLLEKNTIYNGIAYHIGIAILKLWMHDPYEFTESRLLFQTPLSFLGKKDWDYTEIGFKLIR